MKKTYLKQILWAVFVIPLIIGLIIMNEATVKTEYSTDEYWVAKDYAHVYEKYSGSIINDITAGEKCEIEGDTITVTEYKEGLYTVGSVLSLIFGLCTASMIWFEIQNSEWWQKHF